MNSFTFTYLSQGFTLQVRFRLRSELKTRLLALILTITKKKANCICKEKSGYQFTREETMAVRGAHTDTKRRLTRSDARWLFCRRWADKLCVPFSPFKQITLSNG